MSERAIDLPLPRGRFAGFFLALVAALAIGLLCVVHPIAAIALVALPIVGALALRDASALVGATLFLHMVGERQGFSYASVGFAGFHLFPNDLLTVTLLVVVVLRALREGRALALPRDPIDWALWAFLLYGVFSMVRGLGLHGWASILSFRLQFSYAVLFLLVRDCLREKRSRANLGKVILAAGVVVGLQGIWNAVTGTAVGAATSTGTYRYLSGLQALTLVFALAVLFGGVWPTRRPAWSVALAGLYLVGILLAQARSVWLGAILGVTTVAFAGSELRRHGAKLLIAMLVGIGVLLLALPRLASLPVVGDVYSRLTSFQDLDRDATSLWRLVVWTSALLELRSDPILGLGLGKQFSYWDVVRGEWDKESQMHNSYLELAYYTGAVGVGLLILFQTLVLIATLRAARAAAGTPRSARLKALAAVQVCFYAVAFTNVIGASMTSATFGWILAAWSMSESLSAERLGNRHRN
ncbi:MAG: O-antigen ligase family protein [Candidatus Eisenbacteria bacterium]